LNLNWGAVSNDQLIKASPAATNADPLDRINYTNPADKRGLEVIDRVAKLAKWEPRPSP
jgi:hypothetical protein